MSKLSKALKEGGWKQIVASIAPTVGTALGGPFGAVAGTLLSRALTGKDDASEEEIAAVLNGGNPEAIVKLKEVETNFKLEMERLGIEKESLIYKDIDSARRREMAVMDWMPKVLGLSAFFGFIGYLVAITFFPPAIASDVIIFLLGQLSGMAMSVFQYYFGSSLGSKVKTDQIAEKLGK